MTTSLRTTSLRSILSLALCCALALGLSVAGAASAQAQTYAEPQPYPGGLTTNSLVTTSNGPSGSVSSSVDGASAGSDDAAGSDAAAPADLAFTGSDTTTMAILGSGMIGAGTVIAVAARRRNR